MSRNKLPIENLFTLDSKSLNKQNKFIDLCHNKRVLELGCGFGEFRNACLKITRKIVSIDIFPQVDGVKKADIIDYLKATRNKFDVVYARHIIEHLFPEKALYMIERSYEVLDKGGLLVIVTANPRNIHIITDAFWREFDHVRPYTMTGVSQKMEKAGFKILKCQPDNDTWGNDIFRRIARRLRGLITGLPQEAPDFYVIGEKGEKI